MTPRDFFAAVAAGNVSAVEVGLTILLDTCRKCRHSLVKSAHEDKSGAALRDLVGEYLSFLYSPQGRPQRELLDKWLGVRVSFQRYLRRARRRDKSIERQLGLYEELLYDKVARVVRRDDRFEQAPPPPRAGFRLSKPPDVLDDLADEVMEARLPRLAPRLEPSGGKSPEVVNRAALSAQLERIFELTRNRARSVGSMKTIVWATLDPPPETFSALPPHAEDAEDEATDRLTTRDAGSGSRVLAAPSELAEERSFGEVVDMLAHDFLRTLDHSVLAVATATWGTAEGPTRKLEEVVKITGIPRASAHRHTQKYEESLSTFVAQHELAEDEAATLLDVLREILSAGDFVPLEGGRDAVCPAR